MIKYCNKRFKLAYKRPQTGRLSILGLPFSIVCHIARGICSQAFVRPGFSGEQEHRESKILNGIIQHEYPGVLSVMSFDLASDILSLINNNKHIFLLKWKTRDWCLHLPTKLKELMKAFFFHAIVILNQVDTEAIRSKKSHKIRYHQI